MFDINKINVISAPVEEYVKFCTIAGMIKTKIPLSKVNELDSDELIELVRQKLNNDESIFKLQKENDYYIIVYSKERLDIHEKFGFYRYNVPWDLNYINLSEKFSDDLGIVIKVIQCDVRNFGKVSERIRSNKKILKKLIDVAPGIINLYLIDTTFVHDREFMEYAAINDKLIFPLSSIFRYWLRTKDFVINVIRQNGLFLEHVHDDFKNNKSIVLIAVSNNPRALKFASKRLRGNTKIVLTAVKKDGLTLKYAECPALNNLKIIETATRELGARKFENIVFSGDTSEIKNVPGIPQVL
jgi:hypothetical protein